MDGDLNANFGGPKGKYHDEEIATALVAEFLRYIWLHLLLHQTKTWARYSKMWSMTRLGREVQYRTDYLLGTDRRLFWKISVRDPQHNSYHYTILGCLHITTRREHTQYFGFCMRL